MSKSTIVGSVYLLHFDRPFGHAKHYTGWAADVDLRIGEHMDGGVKSANIVRKAALAGIGFAVARIWPNKTRNDERSLKKQGGASRRCPICAMERS
jgi:predicted GIY-YIG superfamily endonuclease